jgi:hypothetical protein
MMIQYFFSACIPIDLVPQPQLENHVHNGLAAFDSYYCDYGTLEHETKVIKLKFFSILTFDPHVSICYFVRWPKLFTFSRKYNSTNHWSIG